MFILNSRFKKLFGPNYSTSAYQSTISGVSAAWVAIFAKLIPRQSLLVDSSNLTIRSTYHRTIITLSAAEIHQPQ